jgi:hypothetical protein
VVLTKNKIPLLKTNNKIIDDNHDPWALYVGIFLGGFPDFRS